MTPFSEKVYTVVKQIPRGQTLSYQQVAHMAGNEKAYRAVGNILDKNYDPSIPCHRVIRADIRIMTPQFPVIGSFAQTAQREDIIKE